MKHYSLRLLIKPRHPTFSDPVSLGIEQSDSAPAAGLAQTLLIITLSLRNRFYLFAAEPDPFPGAEFTVSTLVNIPTSQLLKWMIRKMFSEFRAVRTQDVSKQSQLVISS
jgi:hypothetical protein